MKQKHAILLFVLIILIWGINWTVTKYIVLSIPPFWSNALRSLIAAIALFLLQIFTKKCIIPQKKDIPAILIVSVFHMTIFASLMAVGLQYASVGRSAILGYTTPLWVVPAAVFFLREPLHKLRMLGVILGIVGVAVLFAPAMKTLSFGPELFGNALLLAASFSWAITIIGIKMVTWHHNPFQLVSWQLLLATVLSAVIALFMEGIPTMHLTPALLGQLAYSGILGTAFGFWAMTVVNVHLPAIVTSLGLLATPITAIAFSLWFLDEKIDLDLLIAGTFIMLGIALGSVPIKKQNNN